MKEVSPYYEPMPEYIAAVDSATSGNDLCDKLEAWKWIASDAYDCAVGIANAPDPAAKFTEFKKGLKRERRKLFAGETWAEQFADILMPGVMFKVAVTANRFGVPWGVAFNRMLSVG